MRSHLSLLALELTISSAPAASVLVRDTLSDADAGNFHYSIGATSVPLRDSAGAQLAIGSDFRIGFFLNYSQSLDSSLATATYQSLVNPSNPNRFIQIGVGGTTAGDAVALNTLEIRTLSGASRALTTISNVTYATGTANSAVDNALTRGTKLFLFTTNSQDFSTTPTEWGLFSATSWIVPTVGDADVTLAFKEVDTAGEVFHGSLGSLRTAPVPEASTLVFALAALVPLNRRRRL